MAQESEKGLRRKTLVGLKFNRLLVLEKSHTRGKSSTDTTYLCQCDCGNRKIVRYTNIINGTTGSCGCIKLEQLKSNRKFEKTALKNKFNYYVRNAKSRNLDWKLTFEQFIDLVNGQCSYCKHLGRTLLKTTYAEFHKANGVDRIDNSEGYTASNSVTCCEICNRAKGSLTLNEFKTWIKEVYGHLVHQR